MMETRIGIAEEVGTTTVPEPEEFPGLCRVCGSVVPRAGDPASCTPSICSERCLAQAIVQYWAGFGLQAQVSLREGYARLEGLRGILSSI
ncbi:MAG TPA: hypothetical protein VN648_08675 [Candidatus Methylomirabilis sp.]|nr:hypothetical protein [Candidatus Methylomirabilis sp.]